MHAATRRWQPCAPGALAIHRFPDGIVMFIASSRSTCYLPQSAALVFDMILQVPQGLLEARILDSLNTDGAAGDSLPDGLDIEALQSILAALEQQHLIRSCE